MKFRIRTQMVDKIPGNFKNKYKFGKEGLKCIYCFDEMTQIHCTICPGRSEMRSGLDMNNLDDLVTYFQRFLSEEAKKTTT